jgi:hypothetical protein
MILLVLFIVSVLALHYSCAKYNYHFFADWTDMADANETASKKKRRYLVYLFVFIINFPIVATANILYVYIELNYERNIRYISQLIFALFKMRWNENGVMPILTFIFSKSGASITANEHENLMFMSLIAMFNNIAVPCLATAGASSTCFLSLFKPVMTVKSSYEFTYCGILTVTGSLTACQSYFTRTEETSFDPPFVYSYQCASTLMTAYAAVTVYIVIFSVAIILCFHIPIKTFQGRVDKHSNLSKLLDKLVPKTMRKMPHAEEITPETIPPLLFEKDKFVMSVVGKMALLMTFGAVFPPLGVVIACGIFRDTYFYQCLIGRLVYILKKNGLVIWVSKLNNECEGISASIRESLWLITPFVVVFYALFVFDIYGDKVGFANAIWAPIFLIFFTLAVSAPLKYYHAEKYKQEYLARKTDVNRDSKAEAVVSPIQDHNTEGYELTSASSNAN